MPFGFGIGTASVVGVWIGLASWRLAAGLASSSTSARRFLIVAEKKPLGFPWCFSAVGEPGLSQLLAKCLLSSTAP